jgi:hypothetical protein
MFPRVATLSMISLFDLRTSKVFKSTSQKYNSLIPGMPKSYLLCIIESFYKDTTFYGIKYCIPSREKANSSDTIITAVQPCGFTFQPLKAIIIRGTSGI